MSEQTQSIGETAGKIYRVLEQNGSIALTKLQKEIASNDAGLFHQAVGWLAREGKIDFQKSGKSWTLVLTTSNVC